ncbi:transglycosylase domain-containing protein [Gemelliphila asaccharolytica]|uniref:Penicillin-binding protein 1A/1B family protein n=1 Tax=Gemelliphila asaccharolytica TaxID=502393 RepID=A0ABR5TQ02_9BACL|nr:transglycosylase domain-containing protein [Gemella asaccharolytica]KXB59031.1 penicillin-binding protein 1A/1B family protein [Gemella asaccharolytica]
MDDNKKLSRRERYKNIDPGGYASRKKAESNSSENKEIPIRRSAPKRSSISEELLRKKLDKKEDSYRRISRPLKKKTKIKSVFFKYFLYASSISIIVIFLLFSFWIFQAPAFDSSVLDNNNKTIVYDINEKEVAKLGNKIGENAEMSEVPELMQDAILATEDNRFFEHGAVDYKRLIGATISNITSGFGTQGGSTISQQLIKRTFLEDKKSMKRKVQEAYLAYKLEQNYDKESIFNMYINRIYYSDGVYGLKTAANYYYGKELNQLSLSQIALLAGLPQQPNAYNPYDHKEAAKERRDTVLHLMAYHGKITEDDEKKAKQTDVMQGIVPRNSKNRFILSSEFDESLTAYMSQVATELRKSKEFEDYEGDVLNLGLKVYTNLDTNIQKNIYDSVANNTAQIKKETDVAMVVLNNENSGISAIYGGKNFKFGGFNYATQSKLQPGSSIKPILDYAPAVEYLGWSTNQIIQDTKIEGSEIQNWDRAYHGNVTMNYALTMSFNIPAIRTFQAVGFKNVQKYAHSVGMEVKDESITTAIGGSSDGYSPLQMAGAYVPFSNGGYYQTPKTIKKVYDNDGVEIRSFSKNDKKQVLKESSAYIMTSMLRNVVNGTARQAAIGGADMGVKTGTTTFSQEDADKYGFDINNSAKDSWVVGYTSGYTLSIWQGFDKIENSTNFMNINDTTKTQVLFRNNMLNIIKQHSQKAFSVPKDISNYKGGLKVLTSEEKKELAKQAEQAKRVQQEKQRQEKVKEKENADKKENDDKKVKENKEKQQE